LADDVEAPSLFLFFWAARFNLRFAAMSRISLIITEYLNHMELRSLSRVYKWDEISPQVIEEAWTVYQGR
jgi:hypothetical protein